MSDNSKLNDWRTVRLAEVTVKITDRDHYTPIYTTEGVIIVSPKDFDESGRINFSNCKYVSETEHQRNRRKTDIKAGDLVFTRIGARLGKACFVTPKMPEFSLLHSAVMIRVAIEHLEPMYLLYVLKGEEIQTQISQEIQSIGVPDLGLDKINAFRVSIPPLAHQRKIAKILTTVDNLIEKTEALIAKYQFIKQGMMHDLFTRGIDAKGKLRPPQSEGMSNQKACLKDLVFNVKDKLTFNKDMSKPYLGLEHLPSSAAKLICKGSASDSISSNNIFESGDILFGKLRPRLKKCIQVNFDGYCSTDILVLRAYPTVCSKYAGKILQSDDVFKEAIRSEEGTKMPRTSWRSIKEIQVFTPPLSQQRKIAEILSKQDQLIEDHEKELMKYKNLKTALMQNLLTGKVQVSPDAEDKELAHA